MSDRAFTLPSGWMSPVDSIQC